MSEHSRRSNRVSWRSRERKLRGEYRRKLVVAVIVALIIGILGGIILDKLLLTKKIDNPTPSTPATTEMPVVEATSEPEIQATAIPEVTAEPVVEPVVDETSEEVEAPIETEDEANPFSADIESESEEPGEPFEIPKDTADESAVEPATEVVTIETPAVEETAEPVANDSAVAVSETPVETATEEPEVEDVPEESEPAADDSQNEPAVQLIPSEDIEAPATEIEEPESIAEPEPTPEPVTEAEPIVVPYGEAYTMTTDINPDGTAHCEDDGSDYENLSLTMQVQQYLDYDYYDSNYGTMYNLHGGTAAVKLTLTLNDYEGKAPIIPQNFLLLTFCDASGEETTQGVQLMDKEIKGNTDIQIISNIPATMYKRFYKEGLTREMAYLVATTYNNGVPQEYRFEILIPAGMATPKPTEVPELYPELARGSTDTEAITELQNALKKFGVLSGKSDGIYGSDTETAVMAAQKQLGLEETGIATNEFQIRLFNITKGAK